MCILVIYKRNTVGEGGLNMLFYSPLRDQAVLIVTLVFRLKGSWKPRLDY